MDNYKYELKDEPCLIEQLFGSCFSKAPITSLSLIVGGLVSLAFAPLFIGVMIFAFFMFIIES